MKLKNKMIGTVAALALLTGVNIATAVSADAMTICNKISCKVTK